MFDDDSSGLGVDFTINPSESFEQMAKLLAVMASAEGKILASATKIEGSTSYMVKLDGPAASVKQFASTATREMNTVRSALDGAGLSVEALARVASEAAGISIVGPATSRDAENATREINRTEKEIERLIVTMDREAASVGKTRDQLRDQRIETLALTAAEHDLGDANNRLLASRRNLEAARQGHAEDKGAVENAEAAAVAREAQALRDAAFAFDKFEAAARKGAAAQREFEAAQAAADREDEAQRLRSAAFAHDQFEATVRRGAQAMREEEAAAASDAAALARLRAMLDPAGTAQARLNAELVEARRVMTAAGASAEELARAEAMLVDRANIATQTHGAMAGAANKSSGALKNIAVQLPDITQGLLTGQKPMQVFIQQGAQIFQVAQMSQGGLRGFGKEVAMLAVRFSPLLIGMAAVGAGFALFNRWVNEGVKSDQLTRDLGKITGGANATKQELYKLKEETVTWADTSSALFSVVGKDISDYFVGDMKGMSKGVKGVLDDLTTYMRQTLAGIYAGVAGTKAYLGEIEKGGVVGLGKMLIGQGDPKLLEKTYGAAYNAADQYLTKLGKRVKVAAIENARERIAKSIGYNNFPKPKTDKHAEQLARDAAAIEAEIRNLYALADAYGVSGAAALIAEARVKAESKAIRARADIEAAVAREVRLAVAQRVSDAAKSTATMRDQALLQEQVNASVAAGISPAERAGELLRDRIADLPLLAAIEAAQKTKDVDGAKRAEQALDDQRAARDRLTDAERKAAIQSAMSSGANRLAEIREETRLIGASDAARVHALATLKATQEATANGWIGADARKYIDQQVEIADAGETNRQAQESFNASLTATADLFDTIDQTAQRAAQGMADAFGNVGSAIGDAFTVMTGYYADQAKLQESHEAAIRAAGTDQARIDRENRLYSLRSSSQQIGAFGDMTSAAKGFFKEGSGGYKAMAAAEKVFRTIELAMAVKNAAVQLGLIGGVTTARVVSAATGTAVDTAATAASVANSMVRATADATAAMAKTAASSPFPFNLAGMAVMAAALASLGLATGFFGGGSKNTLPKANEGTGTVLGDTSAKSDSIKNAIDALKEVDTLTNTFAREMSASLKSIDSQIGGVASLVVRSGNIDASSGVTEGFKANAIGSVLSKIPVIGGILGGLFGSKTSVIGSGLYGGAQSVGDIMNGGFDASYYSDIEKKKKLFGLTTSTKYSTQYSGADAGLENQFTLILKSFNDAIAAAAGPLGVATGDVQARLNGFIVNIGKIDLKGLTGEQIEEKLSAVFGAAADGMAAAAFPGLEQFQKVGEGVFETLVRVASTVEAVGASLDMLGTSSQAMGIGVKLALADQFDSVSALTDAVGAYFETFYSKEEQAAAKTAQMTGVFASLGVAMPATLSAFRQLVEAQDLTTSAGQSTYATLLKLAPAFADLQASMEGAKSAADIASERQDLQRQLLELQGDTAAIRALDLAKLDASNRALQQQIYAIQDAQAAATAAKALSDAWTSVGDSIMDEVKRIRGLTDVAGVNSFASLQGQFNAATTAARGGDQDAAKNLPALSQALLTAAAEQATSRQELSRVQAQTAASLEATFGVVTALTKGSMSATTAVTTDDLAAAISDAQTSTSPTAANDDLLREIKSLREEVTAMRNENNSGHAATAGSAGRIDRRLEAVTSASGGDAISVASAA